MNLIVLAETEKLNCILKRRKLSSTRMIYSVYSTFNWPHFKHLLYIGHEIGNWLFVIVTRVFILLWEIDLCAFSWKNLCTYTQMLRSFGVEV